MNKKIALIGIVGLLLVASTFAFAQGTGKDGKEWIFGDKKAAFFESRGIGEDSTKEEIMEAMYKDNAEFYEQKMDAIREKMGLPSNATIEEVKTAMQEWKEENAALYGEWQGKMDRKDFEKTGFHKKFYTGKKGKCPFSK